MSNYVVSDSSLTAVADAIRAKGGTSAALAFPTGFADAIAAIPSGGGGASNFVTGTFKGTTSAVSMDIDLAYTGSGYPIGVLVGPTSGLDDTYNAIINHKGTSLVSIHKRIYSVSPDYIGTGDADKADCLIVYKNARDSGSIYGASTDIAYAHLYEDANAGSGTPFRIRSSTKVAVYIKSSTSNGFIPNVEYTYRIIYSS